MRQRSREAIQWREQLGTFVGRIREPDGRRTEWTRLHSSNREIAQKNYDEWFLTGRLPMACRGQRTFEDEARAFVALELESADETDRERGKDRLRRFEAFAFPVMGMVPVALVESGHVAAALDHATLKKGKAAGTASKLKSDISVVLAALVRNSELRTNVAIGVAVHADSRVDTRRRMLLSDAQIVAFHDYHGYVKPVAMKAFLCRQIAGHRTSDIHAADYEHMDTAEYAWMHVRRPKTDGQTGAAVKVGKARKTKAYELIEHKVRPELRPLLRAYHQAAGSPKRGPLFPLLRDGVEGLVKKKDGTSYFRRGSKAGERKSGTGNSYAKALRRMVWEAKLYSPMPVGTLVGGVKTTEAFDPEHPRKEICFFQTDTDTTRRLDFHGLRGALATAVADAGASLVDQLSITGHTQLSTQMKHYIKKRTVEVPAEALPNNKGLGLSGVSPTPPTPDTHAVLAALAALAAKVDALGQASPEGAPTAGRPQIVGTKRVNSGLRVLAGGKKG